MAAGVCMLRKVSKLLSSRCNCQILKQPVRHGWSRLVSRGKRPENARSLADRLAEINAKDPVLDREINIGFPKQRPSVSRKDLREWKVSRKAKEQEARLGTLLIDFDEVKRESEPSQGLNDCRVLAEHYGIYRDLFDNAVFDPSTCLQVLYDYDDEYVAPVYRGNRIEASKLAVPPSVHYEGDGESLYCIVLTNPDGHLQDNTAEVLHWFIGNIPGDNVRQGEIICDYLPPFPVKGTGLHRLVFLLYKQNRKLDFSLQRKSNSTSLEERTFKTFDFYSGLQEEITPAGLAFCQTDWDESVTNTFHNILDMPEPSFDFVHPPIYHPKQVKFPKRQPFDLYLDRYRDISDIREEVLREKLKTVSPFSKPVESQKYPNIGKLPPTCPTWLQHKIQKQRLRLKQWTELS